MNAELNERTRLKSMQSIFGDFDFALLDHPDFREDSVREELIVPLLKALGYSAAPPYRIVRSKSLEHPFVYFGTVRKGISIVPDYLLEQNGKYAWVLDAKAPSECIDCGKNVEQAYSYAMHKDVRVPIYALCNGHKLTVFHIHFDKPLFDISLREMGAVWPDLLTVLGSRSAWQDGRRPDFAFDLGLALAKAGFSEVDGKPTKQMFLTILIHFIGRLSDGLYTISAPCSDVNLLDDPAGTKYMMSFDFGEGEYKELLTKLDSVSANQIRAALSQQPFKLAFESPILAPNVAIASHLGDHVYTNENESYRPFVVEKFF